MRNPRSVTVQVKNSDTPISIDWLVKAVIGDTPGPVSDLFTWYRRRRASELRGALKAQFPGSAGATGVTQAEARAFLARQNIALEVRTHTSAALPGEQTDTAISGALEKAAPLEQVQKAPAGMPKSEIISVDWPLLGRYTQESLSEALSDVPDWLKPARVARGAPGGASSLWNPAKLADCLLSKGHANQKALCSFLGRHFGEWMPEWEALQGYR